MASGPPAHPGLTREIIPALTQSGGGLAALPARRHCLVCNALSETSQFVVGRSRFGNARPDRAGSKYLTAAERSRWHRLHRLSIVRALLFVTIFSDEKNKSWACMPATDSGYADLRASDSVGSFTR
jgi:hypothetical protein